MDLPLVTSTTGVLAILAGICAFYYWVEEFTQWRLFRYFPPLLFIYATPVLLTNWGVLPSQAPVYDSMGAIVLPMMLTLLMLKVNIASASRIMGRGLGVMLFGSLGVVVGGAVASVLVKPWLGPDAWKAFGALAASWVGGTANMAAVGEMLDMQGTEFGLAVLADSTIYLVWLPLLLASVRFAEPFARFTGAQSDATALQPLDGMDDDNEGAIPATRHYLYLLAIAWLAAWLAEALAKRLPVVDPLLSTSTWHILIVTTIGICLSLTPLRRIPGSHPLAMALVFLFVARMGAMAELSGVANQAIPFLLGASVWILIHGAFCVLGAKLLRVDIHTTAIASAANIGGAASAAIVASAHQRRLIPVGILMALLAYALGNYAGYLTAILCRWLST